MLASVIIPTYKRFHTFKKCVESLLAQDFNYDSLEIIAVHDGEDHGYDPSIMEKFMREGNFQFYAIKKAGASEARNFGISRSRGKYILMTDDDCIASSNWISKLVSFIETHPEMSAVGGQVLAINPETYIQEYIKFKNLLRRPVRNIRGEVVTLITANVVYRKDVLEKISGFSPLFREREISCGGEDLDLAFRAARYGKLGYCEDAIVYHHHRSSLRALAKQHFNYGRGVFIACVNNNIPYKELRFLRPTFFNLFRHAWMSTLRIFTISIPEYREKGLACRHYLPYFGLDLLRRNVFMIGAVYEFHRYGEDAK